MRTLDKYFGIILFLFFSFSLFSQPTPPGTVRLNSSDTSGKYAAFIDQSEICIMYWQDFLHWTEIKYGKESPEYKALLPDSIILSQVFQGDWQCPVFRHYPIVGISYEQAIAYCAWRSDRVNERYELLRLENKRNKKKYNYIVTYSLPTETDFEEAYKQQKIKTNYTKLTFVVWEKGKFANIADNAQELTANKTVLTGENSGKLIFQPYKEPNAIVGFRCVANIYPITNK